MLFESEQTMTQNRDIYNIEFAKVDSGLSFVFQSKGKKIIQKIIDYSLIHPVNGVRVFNLGFGDYIPESNIILDKTVSENGDAFKVLNTVLFTIPIFFLIEPQAMIMVRGSDSELSYVNECRKTCRKKCSEKCRNQNRRVTLYSNFIEKNFDRLSSEYEFFGSFSSLNEPLKLEDFILGSSYAALFVKKI